MSFTETASCSDLQRKERKAERRRLNKKFTLLSPSSQCYVKRVTHHVGDASDSIICSASSVLGLFEVVSSASSVSDAVRFIEDFGN